MFDTLLPHNATPQEIALDLATARVGGVPVDIHTVMDPQACSAALLPWLAWSLSVDEWDAAWSEETKRATIAASVAVHRRKGTRAALRAAIDAAGYGDAEIVERFGYIFYNGTRRHNGGNNNYARGAADITNTAFWPNSQVGQGVTATITARGFRADGTPFVRVALTGTAPSPNGTGVAYLSTAGRVAAAQGTYTVSAVIAKVSGTAAGTGLRVSLIEEIAPSTSAGNTPGNAVNTVGSPATSVATRTTTTGNQLRPALQWAFSTGTVMNEVFEIDGLQLELGSARTVLNFDPLTHGSADHWAEYRLNLARPITIAQAAQVRRIAESVAPLRSRLKLLTYTAAQHLYDGTILNNGTFAHGAA